ncbi:MAG TPA: hypothetical protein GYA07_13485 [Verrucomicrobia bacterium]|mgnify:CR=1 FL=1|nr:hypothetical protein [Verrucomicrobiota bacterium]HOP97668.1 hypothetical protein [Verrucomicrobiota bacterium]HPU57533.1 hypothetical protein [Verrucomicrobiota bacterium]
MKRTLIVSVVALALDIAIGMATTTLRLRPGPAQEQAAVTVTNKSPDRVVKTITWRLPDTRAPAPPAGWNHWQEFLSLS